MAIILTVRHISALWVGPDGRLIPFEQRRPDVLKRQQAAFVAQNPATHPPQELKDPIPGYIGNGCWRIKCRCNARTHTDPAWKQAYCFSCGAIWTDVAFPADWRAIEDLLTLRPVQGTRNWARPETYWHLVAEQMDHGDPT